MELKLAQMNEILMGDEAFYWWRQIWQINRLWNFSMKLRSLFVQWKWLRNKQARMRVVLQKVKSVWVCEWVSACVLVGAWMVRKWERERERGGVCVCEMYEYLHEQWTLGKKLIQRPGAGLSVCGAKSTGTKYFIVFRQKPRNRNDIDISLQR